MREFWEGFEKRAFFEHLALYGKDARDAFDREHRAWEGALPRKVVQNWADTLDYNATPKEGLKHFNDSLDAWVKTPAGAKWKQQYLLKGSRCS